VLKFDTNLRNPSFFKNNLKKNKSPSANAKGLVIFLAPQAGRVSQLLFKWQN